jgi:ribonuclease D
MSLQYAISKAEINEKPLLEYEGAVTLVKDDMDVGPAVEVLSRETVLGFDTETRPAFRKGESYLPSLLQLAGEDHVWIFQIQQLGDLTGLFELLARREILKCGVAIARDVKELKDLSEFKPAGFMDLGHMAEKRGFKNTGLRPLTALLLEGRISKSAQVSNWAAKELDAKQITYAATDAWVSRRLYFALKDLPEVKKEKEQKDSE